MSLILALPGNVLAGPDDLVIITSQSVPRKLFVMFGQSDVQSAASRVPTGIVMSQATTIAPSFMSSFANASEIRQAGAVPNDPPLWPTTGGGSQGPVPVAPRGVNTDEPAGGIFGPYLSAAHDLDFSVPFGWHVAYFGLGGSTLATNWKDPNHGGGYPGSGPKLADLFVTFVTNALSSLGLTMSDLAGLGWSHGTSDALVTANANAYATNFTNLFGYLVPLTGGYIGGVQANGPVVPWFIENPNSFSGGGADLTTVKNSKVAFVAATPNTFLISAENLPFFGAVGNETHYPADGNIIMGQRYSAQQIAAGGYGERPRANFKWFATALSLAVTDTSTISSFSSIASWGWAYGDGGTATGQSPSPHVYAAPGSYSVTLTVTGASGKSSSITWVVIVVAAVTWTIDATALIACPASSAESTAMHAALLPSSSTSGPPTHIWGMQDNCQVTPFTDHDLVGSIPLGAQNAFASQASMAPLWSRVGNQFADNVANRNLSSSNAGLPDASVTSTMLIWHGTMPAAIPAGGAARGFMNCGVTGNTDLRISLTTGKLRQVAVLNTEIVNNLCDGAKHFVIVQDNFTAGRSYVFTDREWFALPHRAPASGKFVGIGSGAANSSASACVLLELYEGAAAEKTPLEIWRLMTGRGWSLAWAQPL